MHHRSAVTMVRVTTTATVRKLAMTELTATGLTATEATAQAEVVSELLPSALNLLTANVEDYAATAEHYAHSLPMFAVCRVGAFDQLKRVIETYGLGYYFSRNTMRMFGSKIESRVTVGGRFFLTSECNDGTNNVRVYSVRWVTVTEAGQATVNTFKPRFNTRKLAAAFAKTAHDVLPFPGTERL